MSQTTPKKPGMTDIDEQRAIRNGLAIGYEARGKEIERLKAELAPRESELTARSNANTDAAAQVVHEGASERQAMGSPSPAAGSLIAVDELLDLLRFRRLDGRNGTLAGEPDAIRLCGAAADEIARLRKALGEIASLGEHTLFGGANMDPEHAFQAGAFAAFCRTAEIARAVLEDEA